MVVGLRNVLLLSVCLILSTGQAWAVALGKLEVTSHLGETFFAEAPIQLEEGETISKVSVELAAPSDYQILEVYRDNALNRLSVQVVKDSRGPRAVIKSVEAVDTPYFNLVLKLSYGHATNFKKYPVFLDLPEQIRPPVAATAPVESTPAVEMQAEPAASTAVAAAEGAAVGSGSQAVAVESTSAFKPYAGWARSGRYGPMVHGDTITTVARRLRVDDRFTLRQVMVGLYNKNKDKFRENNINLINAGTYLDVPSAAEVESVTDSQAKAVLKDHAQRWRMLKKQPVYAAEAEAQANRYRTRVRVGQTASGTAAAPMQTEQAKPESSTKDQGTPKQAKTAPTGDATTQAANEQLSALQAENLRLKEALQASEATAASAKPTSADAAAAEEQVKKLELTVVRLQRQLKQVNDQLQEVRSQDMNSLVYAMGGVIVLLIAVAGYLLFLLRRDRPHPSMPAPASRDEPHPETDAAAAAPLTSGTEDVSADESGEDEFDHESIAASLDADLQDDLTSGEATDDTVMLEDKVPIAQSGIDYLAEAEVYLRYGMDDEALQQMELAIEQKPDHVEAHTKLVQFLQTRGDQEAVDVAIAAARSALGDGDLQAFEDSIQAGHGEADSGESIEQGDSGDAESASNTDLVAGGESESDERTAELDLSDMFGSTETDTSEKEATDDEGLSFDMSEPAGLEAAEEETTADSAEHEGDDGQGLDFTSPDASDLEATGLTEEVDDKPDIAFESNDEGESSDGEELPEIDTDGSVDEADIEAVLGEFGADAGQDDEAGVDFESAASGVKAYEQDADEEDVPETVIESESGEDGMGIEDILGELSIDEHADSEAEESIGMAEETDEPAEEEVSDSTSTDKDMALDDILDEFENDENEPAEKIGEEGDSKEDAAVSSESVDVPDMDVGDELDGLLAEWNDEGGTIDIEASPENLGIDRARSLLAEDSLDEAEASLQAVLDGDRRGDALIGLAEVAAKRGDEARRDELLAEAESLVDDQNREWFDSIRGSSH